MAKAQVPLAPAKSVERYDRLLAAARPPIERKGATNPYTSLNGHMFSHLGADGTLALRLPTQARERFLRDYRAALLIGPHGKPMAEFVAVPEVLFEDTLALAPWIDLARAHVSGLKPKPSARAKAV